MLLMHFYGYFPWLFTFLDSGCIIKIKKILYKKNNKLKGKSRGNSQLISNWTFYAEAKAWCHCTIHFDTLFLVSITRISLSATDTDHVK